MSKMINNLIKYITNYDIKWHQS